MRNPLVAWLTLGAMLEVIGLATVGLLYVLDVVAGADARDLAVKATVAILILAISGGVVGMLLAQKDAPKA
jgi:hypothetical protein